MNVNEYLRKSTIYQIFPRNYSKEGTFKKITEDLDRIESLGVNILYLLPINKIGEKERKGTYGSPYATQDYFSISPDLGTLEDLKELVDETHKRGMKIILDMVFNHTAPDCVLFLEHPDYYYLKNGVPGNRVGDWTDIIDLETTKPEVQDYLISVLKYWKSVGFDGFRFDVASIIPQSLFIKAKAILGENTIFLAESVEESFIEELHSRNYYAAWDYELLPHFDALYNYSSFRLMCDFLRTKDFEYLKKYITQNVNEYSELPNLLRANCLENHDQDRVAKHISGEPLNALTILSYILKGTSFIYAGQENGNKHKPELFEKDPVDFTYIDEKMLGLHKTLISLKK